MGNNCKNLGWNIFTLKYMKDAVNVSFYGGCRKRLMVREALLSSRAKEVRNRKKTHRDKKGGGWVCVKKEKKLRAKKQCEEQRGLN